MEERLQKILSASGVVSRRGAEAYIQAGRVTVNGRKAQLGEKADPERDDIRVDGRPLHAPEERTYLMLYKPRGFVTTLSDEKGRRIVHPVQGLQQGGRSDQGVRGPGLAGGPAGPGFGGAAAPDG